MFRQRDRANLSRSLPVRLQAMVESSLGCLYSALFPFALLHMGVEGGRLWAISSWGAVAVLVAGGVVFYVRARPALPSGDLKRGFTFSIAIVNVLVVGLVGANALGIWGEASFGPYLVAVLWSLVVAGLVFLRMVVAAVGLREA